MNKRLLGYTLVVANREALMPHPDDLSENDPVRAYQPGRPRPREQSLWSSYFAPGLVAISLVFAWGAFVGAAVWIFDTSLSGGTTGVGTLAGMAVAEARIRPPRWKVWRAWIAVAVGWAIGGAIGWVSAATDPLIGVLFSLPFAILFMHHINRGRR